jgi:hypothetical protein
MIQEAKQVGFANYCEMPNARDPLTDGSKVSRPVQFLSATAGDYRS